MNHFQPWVLVLAGVLQAASSQAGPAAETAEQKGQRLAIEADLANSGWLGERATLRMQLFDPQGNQTLRQLRLEVIEGTADGDRSRATFEAPADVRGTRLLTWSHKDGNDDQWLYLPAVERVKRISAANKAGSFMGSELAYEDLGSQEPEKYRYRWLAEATIEGRPCDQLERIPVSRNSGYARQLLCLDREYRLPLQIEYYDRKNELLKVSSYSGHERIGRLWRIGTIDVRNVQTGKRSVLTWSGRTLGLQLAAASFEPVALED